MNQQQAKAQPFLLNLACGSKVSFIGNWANIDYSSPMVGVIEMNILDGLTFPDRTFDAVYTAQFVEHLTQPEAVVVLKEIHRVLKPGGILRIVTPDMEELARTYLQHLDKLKEKDDPQEANKYDWIRIEIFDQIVRDQSGGEMKVFVEHCDETMKSYLSERVGYTFSSFSASKKLARSYISSSGLLRALKKIPKKLFQMISASTQSETGKIGRFRQSGEVHRYMHDIYSLTRLLKAAEFSSIVRVDPYTSAIPDWSLYELDVVKGQPDGPYALYLEARKL
jgi:predicted SAM-dependent methyltransferase